MKEKIINVVSAFLRIIIEFRKIAVSRGYIKIPPFPDTNRRKASKYKEMCIF
jgi:hypothetical protein